MSSAGERPCSRPVHVRDMRKPKPCAEEAEERQRQCNPPPPALSTTACRNNLGMSADVPHPLVLLTCHRHEAGSGADRARVVKLARLVDGLVGWRGAGIPTLPVRFRPATIPVACLAPHQPPLNTQTILTRFTRGVTDSSSRTVHCPADGMWKGGMDTIGWRSDPIGGVAQKRRGQGGSE
jgi:hypothetical protein